MEKKDSVTFYATPKKSIKMGNFRPAKTLQNP
jgi:hypothetical protein